MPVNLKDLIKTIIIKFRIIKNMIFSPTIKLIHIHMSHDKEKNPWTRDAWQNLFYYFLKYNILILPEEKIKRKIKVVVYDNVAN